MKRKLPAVSLFLFTCLASIWPASQNLLAQGLQLTAEALKHPDLVVTEARLTSIQQLGIATVSVEVKNIGTRQSAPCPLVFGYVDNLLDRATWRTKRSDLPALAPSGTTTVAYGCPGIPVPNHAPLAGSRRMFLAVVDPAVAAYPSGQVGEETGELNNVFAFTSLGTSSSLPVIYQNPAARSQRGAPVARPGMEPSRADLVVTQIMMTAGSKVVVSVKNIGTKASEPCTLALVHTRDIGDQEGCRGREAQLPGLAPGGTAAKIFEFADLQPAQLPWQGMFIAVVDRKRLTYVLSGLPGGGIPQFDGAVVPEGAGELNNGFGFTYRLSTNALPKIWKNPVAE